MPDYYKILGVEKEASFDQIRSAYLLKAKIYHPDINKGANAKQEFQQLNEAYHILVDRDKRWLYNIKLKEDISLYRKYGKNYENRHTGNYANHSYYASYARKEPTEEEESAIFNKIKKNTDAVLFYSMVVVGVVIILYGIKDLLFEKWEGEKNLIGIVFGLSFTGILLWGWNLRRKIKN